MTILFYSFIFFLSVFFFCIDQHYKRHTNSLVYILFTFLITISSFRWQVGGDWDNYYYMSKLEDLSNLFSWNPTFAFFIYISQKLGIGIFGVNLFITIFLFYSMYVMLKKFNINVLLVLPIFVSIIYFIVLMGYVRQALALGFVFLFFSYYKNKNIIKTIIFLFLAISSHITSIILMPLLFKYFKLRKINLFYIFLFSVFTFYIIYKNYNNLYTSIKIFIIDDIHYHSKGVYFRFLVYMLGAGLFFYHRKLFIKKNPNLIFFFYYSLVIIFGSLVLNILNILSTTVDRLNIYNFLFYVFCLSGTYEAFKNKNVHYKFIALIYCFHYFLLLGWLIFGNYSIFWVNYKFLQ
jgi:hypothetical protein